MNEWDAYSSILLIKEKYPEIILSDLIPPIHKNVPICDLVEFMFFPPFFAKDANFSVLILNA